mmetsp:Transcript_64010/g.150617  ORF Transcript_64010/g.150617 Transcript_64010/m.150617 type:complete len:250 (+) Transcript_64010:138-887(+)
MLGQCMAPYAMPVPDFAAPYAMPVRAYPKAYGSSRRRCRMHLFVFDQTADHARRREERVAGRRLEHVFQKPVHVSNKVAHQIRYGGPAHQHREADQKPREVGRRDRKESEHRHLSVRVDPRPDPDGHENEGNGQKRKREAGDVVDEHQERPPEQQQPQEVRCYPLEVLLQRLRVLDHEDKVHNEGPAKLSKKSKVGEQAPNLELVHYASPVQVQSARREHAYGGQQRGSERSREPAACDHRKTPVELRG